MRNIYALDKNAKKNAAAYSDKQTGASRRRTRYTLMVLALAILVQVLFACTREAPSNSETPTVSEVLGDPDVPTSTLGAATAQSAQLPTVTPLPPQSVVVESANPVALEDLLINVQPVVVGLQQPIFLTHAGDGSGRLFIVEQSGTILVWQDNQLLDEPFLDVGELISRGHSEQGLLGLAFEPNYAETGRFYINYTDRNGDTVVARYLVSEDDLNRANGGSAQLVLQIQQPAGNHNGGMLAFGPDGYLYIGMGDGGASFDLYGNGQNPRTLLGSLLRIDVATTGDESYAIPIDNPWVNSDLNGVDALDELWAIGLRNPWRFSFDRKRGELWIADVGQNQYEEVNVLASDAGGGNYGWPIQEATHCVNEPCDPSGLIQPVLEYDHQGNCSITGGYVYRGKLIPELNGFYLYGDYCSGVIWAAAQDRTSGEWRSTPILNFGRRISSFGEDEIGNLYVLDHGGTIYQIVSSE